MTTQDAINLLTPIPEDEFIEYVFSDEWRKCCAIGHLVRLTSADPRNYSTENCRDRYPDDKSRAMVPDVFEFRKRTEDFLREIHDIGYGWSIAEVNNHQYVNGYTESTPKARVLHFLEDMQRSGY